MSLLSYSLYVNIGITSNTVATDWQYVNWVLYGAQHPMYTPQTETCIATAQQF